MRYLPVFLDLQTGPVVLVGSGELALAKLRVLAAAGARIRWYATSTHDAHGLEPAQLARIDFAKGDPLTAVASKIIWDSNSRAVSPTARSIATVTEHFVTPSRRSPPRSRSLRCSR